MLARKVALTLTRLLLAVVGMMSGKELFNFDRQDNRGVLRKQQRETSYK